MDPTAGQDIPEGRYGGPGLLTGFVREALTRVARGGAALGAGWTRDVVGGARQLRQSAFDSAAAGISRRAKRVSTCCSSAMLVGAGTPAP